MAAPSLARSCDTEMALQSDHRKTGPYRLATLVLLVDPCPRERLGLVLHRENAETDGEVVLERQVLQPPGALLADIIVVRGLATDDTAERHETIEARALGRTLPRLDGVLDRRRDLERAGHRDALVAGARLVERRHGSPQELVGDVRVVARLHDQDMRRPRHQPPTPSIDRRSTTVRP